MTWIPLLLADPSPCLRLLVLRELLDRPQSDAEVAELEELRAGDPLVAELLDAQRADGSWGWTHPASVGGAITSTAMALARLGYLGVTQDRDAVRRGAEYLFGQQRANGSWPIPSAGDMDEGREGYSMVPLQTAIPLWGLASCGYATDPQAERAYEWLLTQRLPDGAWPTGIASGVYGRVAGYRRLAHSLWGCRSNTTGALSCLSLHPQRRSGEAARRALDLLLGRETRERRTVGFSVARLLGAEPARGFFTFYARFDLAQVLDLCWRVGASAEDERIRDLVSFVTDIQGTYGLWEYQAHPQVARWLSFDILRSLSRLGEHTGWLSLEPRTPFQPYPHRDRRF